MKKIDKRRRRENKTDYKHRKKILGSNLGRIAFRKTNKYIIGQYIKSNEAQDKVIISTNSKELLVHGWPKEWSGSLKSMPAAYLTGYLMGKKILKNKENKAIIDIGLIRNIPGSRIYSFVKGIIDSGVEIPHNKKVLPKKDRIEGMHMKKDIKKIIEGVLGKIK